MARAVYSTRFLAVGTSIESETSFVVPSGYVAVIKDVTVLLAGAAGAQANVYLDPSHAYILNGAAPSASNVVEHWYGHQVAFAGETIALETYAVDVWTVLASGYLLSA